MGGKPCIRRMRLTVGTIVGLVAQGYELRSHVLQRPFLEFSFFECLPNLFNLVRLSFGPNWLQVDGVETLTRKL